MADTAARLTDRVLPAVPVRQWVLSLPFDLRAVAAFRADVLAALARIFVDSVFRRYRGRARDACGAVTFVQRFGSSLNLHVHFHVVVLDGVFTRDEAGALSFRAAPEPTRAELSAIVRRTHRRARAWLERRDGAGTQETSPLDACAAIAMRRGTIDRGADGPGDGAAASRDKPRAVRDAVDFEGFNLDASVRIAADDDLGRERLCRYGARPPLSLERLRILPGGRLAYRIKKLSGARAKVRVMTPLEFLARLSALVPPPRYPLVRYHGVLAPRSRWRAAVVPKPREPAPPPTPSDATTATPPAPSVPTRGVAGGISRHSHPAWARREDAARSDVRASPERSPDRVAASRGPADASDPALPTTDIAGTLTLTPNVLSVRHWRRLLDGTLLAPPARVDWATLLRRTFAVDVLECRACQGRLRIIGAYTKADVVRRILTDLGLTTLAPVPARARDPTGLLAAPAVD